MNKPDKASSSHTIEVRLTIPKIGWLEKVVKTIRRFYKKRLVRIVSAVVVLVVVTALVAMSITQRINSPSASNETNPLVTEQDIDAKVPYYATLLPAGKTIEQLGGWTRVSPADRNAAFAYDDVIGVDRIVVSQQPLPEDFKEDTAFKVEELAKGYKATEKLSLSNLTVYIANSAKGPQSVIFHKSGLLVLIRSSVPISVDAWTAYVTSLQ